MRIRTGFTLIELLLVVAIISALAVTVFVALNPAQRMKDSRDARRSADVETILSAIHTQVVDKKGSLPSNMPAVGVEAQLGTGNAADCSPLSTGGCAVLAAQACVDLLSGTNNLSAYLKSMPIDPLAGATWTAAKTGYSVVVDANGIVTVKACATGTGTSEGANNISASR